MAVAANMPDADIVSMLGGTAAYLDYHRGILHSLTAAPGLALLPVALIWAIERRPLPWLQAWFISLVAILSHLRLDWTNSYGIRMLLPWSSEWLRLDTVFVVDPLIWVLLSLGLLAPLLGKLVSSEIGAKPGRGTGWAITVLGLLCVYEYGRYLAHERALATLNSRIYNGSAPVRVAAFAKNSNPLVWSGLVETGNAYSIFDLNLRDEFDPGSGRIFYKAEASPRLEAAQRTRDFEALLRFSNFLLWRVTPAADPEGGSRVELFDLRFGNPEAPGLAASALVDSHNAVRETRLTWGSLQPK